VWLVELLGQSVEELPGPLFPLPRVVMSVEVGTLLGVGETGALTLEGKFDGGTQTAHHERRTEDGLWVPSMEVVLTKIG
jgi:hypothetical protein